MHRQGTRHDTAAPIHPRPLLGGAIGRAGAAAEANRAYGRRAEPVAATIRLPVPSAVSAGGDGVHGDRPAGDDAAVLRAPLAEHPRQPARVEVGDADDAVADEPRREVAGRAETGDDARQVTDHQPLRARSRRFGILGIHPDVADVRVFRKKSGYREASVSSVRSNHVPESETDFIFCPFAEEWGFMGTIVLVSLYMFMLVRIIIIAERQRAVFNRVYAYTVAMILFYHFAINIGMNIGFAPVIGIPLPFFSYGGSSMMSFSVMMFILLKLDSQRRDVLQ
jgi:hypothetical protein